MLQIITGRQARRQEGRKEGSMRVCRTGICTIKVKVIGKCVRALCTRKDALYVRTVRAE